MASSSKEYEGYYKGGYRKLLDEVKLRRGRVSDEAYAVVVDIANSYREWAMDLGGLDSLPEVPKENK